MMDVFTDIRQKEIELVAECRRRIASVDAEVASVHSAKAIEALPGYQKYLQSVQALLARATDDLVTTSRSNDYLRWQQGRCQALRDVLTILRDSDQLLGQLMERRASLAENLQQLLRLAPKQQEVTDG